MKYFASNKCVYSLQFDIVWRVKYRKKLLTGSIVDDLVAELKRQAQKLDIIIVEVNTNKDHVRMQVYLKPTDYIPDIIKQFKGSTSYMLRSKYKSIRKELYKGKLWSSSYFICSIGETAEDMVSNYIRNQ